MSQQAWPQNLSNIDFIIGITGSSIDSTSGSGSGSTNGFKDPALLKKQDGNGFVSTSEIKYVMEKLDVFFSDEVNIFTTFFLFLATAGHFSTLS